jgi:acetyl esterase/lipase
MLEIGPRWASDIVAHRKAVLAAYDPVLAARPAIDATVDRGIAYGAHPRQILDVHRPHGARNAPIVAFVHGGAFVRGEMNATPHIYGNVPRYFARHGCVGVNIEYRLAAEAAYPGGGQDVAAAMAWLHAHAEKIGGDRSRISLIGHSAGASHVGAYVADPRVRPAGGHGLAAVALLCGRLRADTLASNPNAHGVRAYYGEDAALYEARSVVTHAARFDVPLFLAAAEYENPWLDVYTAELAHRVGLARGRLPRFVCLPGQNHTSMVAHFDAGEELLDRMLLDFLTSLP